MKRTIKGLRNDLGLTQKQMADKIGVPYSSYQRYENYIAKIPTEVIDKIMKLSGITSLQEIKYN